MPPSGPRPPIPPNVARIAVSGTRGNSKWANIFYTESLFSTLNQSNWNAYVSAFATAYGSHIMPQISNATTMTEVRGVIIPAVGQEIVSEAVTSTAGGVAGTDLPAQVAACISWGIGAYYRGGHPRTYVTGILQAFMGSETAFNSTFTGNLQTAAAAFMTAVASLGTTGLTTTALGTLSYARGNAWRVPPIFYPYLSAAVHPRIDTQRRRLGKETT